MWWKFWDNKNFGNGKNYIIRGGQNSSQPIYCKMGEWAIYDNKSFMDAFGLLDKAFIDKVKSIVKY